MKITIQETKHPTLYEQKWRVKIETEKYTVSKGFGDFESIAESLHNAKKIVDSMDNTFKLFKREGFKE